MKERIFILAADAVEADAVTCERILEALPAVETVYIGRDKFAQADMIGQAQAFMDGARERTTCQRQAWILQGILAELS